MTISEVRYLLSRRVLDDPCLGKAYMTLRSSYADYRVDDRTRLVVDGFPRSANTYAYMILRRALDDPVELAGHTHAAATVHAACQRSIPAIVISREPGSAVASFVQLRQGISLGAAISGYLRFHERIRPIAEKVLAVSFDDVIDDMGGVIDRCNERFGLDLTRYHKTGDTERAVMDEIEEASRQRRGDVREAGVARPSPLRRDATDVLRHLSRQEQALLDRAGDLHRELLELSR